MDNLIWFVITLIIVIVVLSILWKALMIALANSPISEPLRPWVTVIALVLLALIIWALFGRYVTWPL